MTLNTEAETGVTVTTEVSTPVVEESTPPASAPVVVVTTDAPDTGGDALPVVIDHEARLVRIEDSVSTIAALLQSTMLRTNEIQETADVALQIAAEPDPEPEPEPDRTPDKPHLLHRSWAEIRKG